ncbi:hypothetical protein AB834_01985 [PVC group bacterium (ex Bugula neritina AB1)]|nr:hypothetical protein AB834_01985 [PVC group bacterium (ex Bugula neritina AB1)]
MVILKESSLRLPEVGKKGSQGLPDLKESFFDKDKSIGPIVFDIDRLDSQEVEAFSNKIKCLVIDGS